MKGRGESILVVEGSEFGVRGAEIFTRAALEAIRRSGRFVFVASGGNTPRPVYETIASTDYQSRLSWKSIHIFLGDERNVNPDDPESNFRLIRTTLFSKVPIPPENIHRFQTEHNDPQREAEEYEREIRAFFNLKAPLELPAFDLVFLGLGLDGHTASLFPDGEPGAEVKEVDPTRLVVAPWVSHLKDYRLSLTPKALNTSKEIVFLVAGSEKASILKKVLEGTDSGGPYPAQRIRPEKGRLTWLVERDAARLLPESSQRIAS